MSSTMNSSMMRSTASTTAETQPLPTSISHMRVSSKRTARRELQRGQKHHIEKLKSVKPSIDMSSPKAYPHVSFNAKRMQMEAERNSAIERENKILLGKMYSIMNAEPVYRTHKTQVSSLNLAVRKQEYEKIARENQAIMQRILEREPNFNRVALDEDWRVTQGYLRNISEYPFILGNLPPATRKRTLKPLEDEPIPSPKPQSYGRGSPKGHSPGRNGRAKSKTAAPPGDDVEVKIETLVDENGEVITRCQLVPAEAEHAGEADDMAAIDSVLAGLDLDSSDAARDGERHADADAETSTGEPIPGAQAGAAEHAGDAAASSGSADSASAAEA